jgi:hypothetical protein
MVMNAGMIRIAGIVIGMVMMWSTLASAQQPGPNPLSAQIAAPAAPAPALPPTAGSEVSNFGTVPFTAQEQLLLRPEDKTALRTIEDRHLKELRSLEDKYEADLRALRQRQADEREMLRKTFRR